MTRIRRHAATGRRLLATAAVTVVTLIGLAVVVPSLLGFHLYAIATGSMTGTLDVGTLAIAREVPVDQLAVGDIITYVPPAETGIGHPVTHRIASIAPSADGATTFVTRGDANADVDPWEFSLEAGTQARVERQVPQLGHPVLALTDPRTRFLAIGIPAVAIAILALRDLIVALRPVRDPQPTEETAPSATPAEAEQDVAAAPDRLIVLPEAATPPVGSGAR